MGGAGAGEEREAVETGGDSGGVTGAGRGREEERAGGREEGRGEEREEERGEDTAGGREEERAGADCGKETGSTGAKGRRHASETDGLRMAGEPRTLQGWSVVGRKEAKDPTGGGGMEDSGRPSRSSRAHLGGGGGLGPGGGGGRSKKTPEITSGPINNASSP